MSRKILSVLFAALMMCSITACGGGSSSEAPESEPATETPAVTSNRDLPEGDYQEMGEGTVYIVNESGTSENGNVIVIYAAEDLLVTQIGLEAWEFNGGALSYIYIDGMLADKMQLSDTQTVLDLADDKLTAGIHTVEVVQYVDDDPAADMTVYKAMKYEVKEM